MQDSPSPPHKDCASQLPADVYAQLIRTLRQALPPPLSDSPADLARRDQAAIAQIAALVPATVVEADLAVLYVAASEQWKECLRLAQRPDISAGLAMKCRGQANSMFRRAQSALGLLLDLQAARQKKANSAASKRAGMDRALRNPPDGAGAAIGAGAGSGTRDDRATRARAGRRRGMRLH